VSADLTGRCLGRYRVDGVLGRGGMSVLYRATDTRLGRPIALKVMGERYSADPEFRARFVEEARNTSAVEHPNVVPLYDFGEADGLLYIALRLVEGADLAQLVLCGPLAPPRTVALLRGVAAALDTLHGLGLVHLDVKPANVLVTTRESAGEHVYLADFGLTRRGSSGHRTHGGDFLGSPTYAAPEHLRGEPVDARADVYSLTCVLYTCLTACAPYRGEVREVIAGHLHQPAPVASTTAGLPEAIDEVVATGMAKDAGARFSTCAELVAAAEAALAASRRGGARAPAVAASPQGARRQAPPASPGPVRLRPPLPAEDGEAFHPAPTAGYRWLLPGVLLGAAVAIVLVLVFAL
jgi:serine/threonine-protein kinase